MHLQSALFTPTARITASVPQFALNIAKRFPELLNFQFLLFYFLSLSVDFAPRVLLTESLLAAINQSSMVRLTPSGTGMVRTSPALPTRSTMAEWSSRHWRWLWDE